ncbi:copper resistance protein CopC [Xylophilus sp. GOD-11R]|uniref:copper resistance protein CopC n=1 Tax=Xylophilus sp. GOD-11R TaxID=3089814 RepID=UPI00298D317C|nr:copper resistance protein CopC [Xylophilus sp. GOD-11R]WPB56908.1 copper resistance protein CopC [Xylophilus sp. GOD-11R]
MRIRRLLSTTLATGLLIGAGAAFAAPNLVSSTPADKAEAAPATPIELHFSDRLVARSSAAQLVMTSMPGMADHPPMGMAVTVSASDDPKVMKIVPEQPLPRGSYRVDWRAVSADRQSAKGSISFTVK